MTKDFNPTKDQNFSIFAPKKTPIFDLFTAHGLPQIETLPYPALSYQLQGKRYLRVFKVKGPFIRHDKRHEIADYTKLGLKNCPNLTVKRKIL